MELLNLKSNLLNIDPDRTDRSWPRPRFGTRSAPHEPADQSEPDSDAPEAADANTDSIRR